MNRREPSAECRVPSAESYWLVVVALAVLAIAATAATAAASAAATTAAAATAAATTTTTATVATATAATAFTSTALATTASAGAAARTTIERRHVLGLRTLLSLTHFELDLLPLLELPEASALNRGEVHETILATIIRRDETVPLLSIEPLHYPCRAHRAQSPVSPGVLLSPPKCGPVASASMQLLLQSVWTTPTSP